MKKAVSFFLCLCMLLSVASFGASAANDSAEMKKVLGIVKNKITIPAEYKEFSFEVTDEGWDFSWTSENTGSTIYISCDKQGRISSFDKYGYEYFYGNQPAAPTLLKSEAIEKVKQFLSKATPEIISSLDYKNVYCNSNYRFRNEYSVYVRRIERNVPCDAYGVSVSINYATGEISSMYVDWEYGLKFPEVGTPIAKEQAKQVWLENTKMELWYDINKTIDKDGSAKNEGYLFYQPQEETSPVDAKTGKLIKKDTEWENSSEGDMDKGYYDAAAPMYEGGAGGGDDYEKYLTEEEIAKAKEYAKLISAKEADTAVRKLTDLSLTADYSLEESELCMRQNVYPIPLENTEDSEYYWELTYRGKVVEEDMYPPTINALVNAKTGKVIAYSDDSVYQLFYGESDKETTNVINTAGAKKVAQRFIEAAQPENAKIVALRADSDYLFTDYEENKELGIEITFTRCFKNIPVVGEGMAVVVDYSTGKIFNFSMNMTDGVQFASPDNKISEDAARKAYIEKAQSQLSFNIMTTYYFDEKKTQTTKNSGKPDSSQSAEPDVKYTPVLVYRFVAPSDRIFAQNGEYCDYWGEAIVEKPAFAGYQDIEGVNYSREIKLLSDIDVLPESKDFKPKDKVAQADFLEYLFRACGYRLSSDLTEKERIEALYNVAEKNETILKGERAEKGVVSRFDGVLFCARQAGYGRLITDSSIFKVNYSDANSIPSKYIGAVAIAKTTNLWKAPGGKFSGTYELTRADAAKLIYNFLAMDVK